MKKVNWLAIVLGVLLTISNGFWVFKTRDQNVVVEVIDGDTFKLRNGERIRLLGINAPELTWCGGVESKNRLEELVLKKTIKVTEEKMDAFNRRMGLVYVGGILVNVELIKTGYVRLNYDKNSQQELFKNTWKQTEPKCKITEPVNKNCVIKGNIETSSEEKYYHLPKCRHYKQVVLDLAVGEKFFCSEKEASAAGFHLAPDCLR